jgi:Domain of unknown function (DUF1990)
VVHQDATSFQLATLDGHLEARQIEFRAAADGDALRFEIESRARAGDWLSHVLYNRLRLAQGDPAEHVVAFLRPHGCPGRRPASRRHHYPHPVARLAAARRCPLAEMPASAARAHPRRLAWSLVIAARYSAIIGAKTRKARLSVAPT